LRTDFKQTRVEKDSDVLWMSQVALALWEIVLKDRYAHVPLFIDFIRVSDCFARWSVRSYAEIMTRIHFYGVQKQEPIKVVNKGKKASRQKYEKVINAPL
jgi:hypothetical protein